MRRIQLAATLAATCLWTFAGTAAAQTKSSAKLSNADRQFLDMAAQTNMAEVQFGKLAQEKGATDAAKDLGQTLVTDHTQNNDELKSLAQSKGVTLPTEPSARDKAQYDRVSRLSDGEFDREFAHGMVMGHEKAIAAFRKEARNSSDTDIKSYASKTVPTLEKHLKLARQLMHSANKEYPRTDQPGKTGR